MTMEWGSVAVLLTAMAASAFFSGAETGLVSVSRYRVRAAVEAGVRGAGHLQELLRKKEKTLTAVLIANNVAVVGAGATATALAERHLGAAGPVVATAATAVALLVLGEMVPKAYFRVRAHGAMLSVAWPLRVACTALKPLVEVASVFSAGVLVLLRGDKKMPLLTREDVRLILRESGKAGVIGVREREMLEGAMDLGATVAREVMIPLSDVVSISEGATVDEARKLLLRSKHTRYPVYRKRVDRIVGVLNVFDILFSDPAPAGSESIGRFVRDIPVVPETKRIDVLLFELQRGRTPMAVIVNEFGTCIGIVTVEDIVEEIMGEITDEHESPPRRVRRMDDGSYLIDARIDIDDLNDELGLRLRKERYDTLGGLVMKRLGRIPRVGESITVDDMTFEVVSVYKFGIKLIRAIPRVKGAGSGGSENA